jgi:hypothetical protein
MNTKHIKAYAPKARTQFIQAVTQRLNYFGISADKKGTLTIAEPVITGSVMQINSKPFEAKLQPAWKKLAKKAELMGFDQLTEQLAYTWFNRFCAIRYMEIHDYLEHGYQVLSHPDRSNAFQILDHAQDVAEVLGLDRNTVIDLKLANKDEELYRALLLGQCHKLHEFMPFLFESLDDETELMLPDNLTRTDSIINGLVDDIPQDDWQNVEIIGWLYQFYIEEKKKQVIGKVVKSEDIPAATQLFTPNWIVQYLVQNSIGRQWMLTYPESNLKDKMPYFIPVAEQPENALRKLAELTPSQIDPESIKVLDPASGSGHILVEAYNTLKEIYEERGYRTREIPKLILENNLYGLDIDDRAAQLAGFALMMKAREDDRRILTKEIKLNVLALQQTDHIPIAKLWKALNVNQQYKTGTSDQLFTEYQIEIDKTDVEYLLFKQTLEVFHQAKTFGSLIEVNHQSLPGLVGFQSKLLDLQNSSDPQQKQAVEQLMPIIKQAILLAQQYDAVIANPPYMGGNGMNSELKKFAKDNFPNSKSDLFAIFIERGFKWLNPQGYNAMVTMQSWMFLSSYEKMRAEILDSRTIDCMAHMANMVMGIAFGTNATIFRNSYIPGYKGSYFFVEYEDIENDYPRTFPPVNERNKTALKQRQVIQ